MQTHFFPLFRAYVNPPIYAISDKLRYIKSPVLFIKALFVLTFKCWIVYCLHNLERRLLILYSCRIVLADGTFFLYLLYPLFYRDAQ